MICRTSPHNACTEEKDTQTLTQNSLHIVRFPFFHFIFFTITCWLNHSLCMDLIPNATEKKIQSLINLFCVEVRFSNLTSTLNQLITIAN